jgi:hypothetical protein
VVCKLLLEATRRGGPGIKFDQLHEFLIFFCHN